MNSDAILQQVTTAMYTLIIEGRSETAKRLALLYDVDYDEFIEKYHGTIVMGKLRYNGN